MNVLKSVAVIGAGAVGTFYGAKLHQLGCMVQFQSRSSANEKPVRVKIQSIWGDFSCSLNYFAETSQMKQADVILVAAKFVPSFDWDCLRKVLHPKSIIVILQNGINIEEKLRKMYPSNAIVGALAFTCIHRKNSNKIHHIDYGLIKLSGLAKQDQYAAQLVFELFSAAKIQVVQEKNLRKLRWEKLLWNIPFNSLSVVLGNVSTTDMIGSPYSLKLVKELMSETVQIAKSEGISMTRKNITDMIERTRKMQPYKTSMLLDFEAGREMEVEAIIGEPLRIAKRKKVKLNVLPVIYDMLKFKNSLTADN
ncbi:MAG: 2-dehydropantoate 2-reductase [Leptospiraceae bacterium]|nr:2-dehydropantoate 2-reductase [Leptospiraceae bacterium]